MIKGAEQPTESQEACYRGVQHQSLATGVEMYIHMYLK